jgi:hypothetical protein
VGNEIRFFVLIDDIDIASSRALVSVPADFAEDCDALAEPAVELAARQAIVVVALILTSF